MDESTSDYLEELIIYKHFNHIKGNYQFLGFSALKLFTYFPLAHIKHFEHPFFICNFVHVCFNPNKAH